MIRKEERLLALVIDVLAERFGKKAILRGGMVLRIMGSTRYTNDLDYIFVPYQSKKEIVESLIDCLKTIEDAEVRYSLNSQCLRVVLTVDNISIQIEAKVATEMKTTALTTQLFSPQFNLPKRIIPIVDHSTSMANKMAAWNERRLVRDIYDTWFYLQMNIKPDQETLTERLAQPNYSKLVEKKNYYLGNSLEEFYEFMRAEVSKLSDKEIEKQMSDYLLPDEMVGLSSLFKAAFVKLK